ncbi:sensor domain-containing diguanylate cyclase [Demequina mangrovi]|uniref:Diguanylate cyclase (GGDEF) domain-containing protein n=1 Tax=Demequina mangrovi TaxID=1043493 RepID=A0A1H6WLF9_9MICO|nr:GGDEF domain-containing protein [Demequina mangrovi]SEJ17758.1 diguanylate cyclase (GGDEF) domain-containing protein [Demequina mangrovi]
MGPGEPEERVSRVPAALSTFFERRAGGLTGPAGSAAGTVNTFAVVSVVTTLLFTLTYLTDPEVAAGPLPWLNGASILAFLAVLALVHRGRQLAAAVLYLAVATTGMVYMAALMGWASGHHFYLITASQLVFLMFTEDQRGWRWFFAAVTGTAFLYAQLATEGVGPYGSEEDVAGMFATNAVGTATLMFLLSVVAQHRARAAKAEAERLAARAEYLANTDPLTGLANRRPIAARLEELGGAEGRAYCVAIADLDRFKELNDVHGHACGDRVLADLGERLRGQVRVTDALGRWGGEEFIVVLGDSTLADAAVMMERMRRIVRERPITCGDHEHRVTVSVGVADGTGDGASHRVVKRADDALYDAKQAGRDCVRMRPLSEAGSSRNPTRPRR